MRKDSILQNFYNSKLSKANKGGPVDKNGKPNLSQIIEANKDKTSHITRKAKTSLPKQNSSLASFAQGGTTGPDQPYHPITNPSGYKQNVNPLTVIANAQKLPANHPYQPSQMVNNTKAALSLADIATSFSGSPYAEAANVLARLANSTGDAYTAIRYAIDGQWGQAGIDAAEALIDLVPYAKKSIVYDKDVEVPKGKLQFTKLGKAQNALIKGVKATAAGDDFYHSSLGKFLFGDPNSQLIQNKFGGGMFPEYHSYAPPRMANGGGPGPEEQAFQKFFSTLPMNLRSDKPDYNIRGYWDALGRPESFDWSQPKQDDGYFHAFSRNPKTGEILKAPFHHTFKQAIDRGNPDYFPIVTPEGKIKTITGRQYEPIEEVPVNVPLRQGLNFANGGDISLPNVYPNQMVPRFDDGGGPCSIGYVRNAKGECEPINKPSKGDSLELYNRALAINNYYPSKGYVKSPIEPSPDEARAIIKARENRWVQGEKKHGRLKTKKQEEELRSSIQQGGQNQIQDAIEYEKKVKAKKFPDYLENLKQAREELVATANPLMYKSKDGNDFRNMEIALPEYPESKLPYKPFEYKDYYNPINDYQFEQREMSHGYLNTEAPMPLYDTRIVPQNFIRYDAPEGMKNDRAEIYGYDPLAIKPYDLRTPQEKVEWERIYGNNTPSVQATPPIATQQPVTPKGPTNVGWNVEYLDPIQKKTVTKSFGSDAEAEQFYNDPANRASRKYSDVSSVGRMQQGGTLSSMYINDQDYFNPNFKFNEMGGRITTSAMNLRKYVNGGALCKDMFGNTIDCPLGYTAGSTVFATQSPNVSSSTSAGVPQRNAEMLNDLRFRQSLQNQASVGPARMQTLDEQRLNQQRKQQFVQNNPNTQLNDQNTIVGINPNRGFQGQPLTPNAKRFDKGLGHIARGLDAAYNLTGAGIGINALRNRLGKKVSTLALTEEEMAQAMAEGIDEAGSYGISPDQYRKMLQDQQLRQQSGKMVRGMEKNPSDQHPIDEWFRSSNTREFGDEMRGPMRKLGYEPTNPKDVENFRTFFNNRSGQLFLNNQKPVGYGQTLTNMFSNPMNKYGGSTELNQYGPGGQTTDGCPAWHVKINNDCVSIYSDEYKKFYAQGLTGMNIKGQPVYLTADALNQVNLPTVSVNSKLTKEQAKDNRLKSGRAVPGDCPPGSVYDFNGGCMTNAEYDAYIKRNENQKAAEWKRNNSDAPSFSSTNPSTKEDNDRRYQLNKQAALQNGWKFNYETGDIDTRNQTSGGNWGYVQPFELAQTFGGFTPSGDINAGMIGANTFVNMTPGIGIIPASSRLATFVNSVGPNNPRKGENAYYSKDNSFGENALGALNFVGDIGMLGIGSPFKGLSAEPTPGVTQAGFNPIAGAKKLWNKMSEVTPFNETTKPGFLENNPAYTRAYDEWKSTGTFNGNDLGGAANRIFDKMDAGLPLTVREFDVYDNLLKNNSELLSEWKQQKTKFGEVAPASLPTPKKPSGYNPSQTASPVTSGGKTSGGTSIPYKNYKTVEHNGDTYHINTDRPGEMLVETPGGGLVGVTSDAVVTDVLDTYNKSIKPTTTPATTTTPEPTQQTKTPAQTSTTKPVSTLEENLNKARAQSDPTPPPSTTEKNTGQAAPATPPKKGNGFGQVVKPVLIGTGVLGGIGLGMYGLNKLMSNSAPPTKPFSNSPTNNVAPSDTNFYNNPTIDTSMNQYADTSGYAAPVNIDSSINAPLTPEEIRLALDTSGVPSHRYGGQRMRYGGYKFQNGGFISIEGLQNALNNIKI